MISAIPPDQHGSASTEPEAGSDEFKLTEVDYCTDPCPYGSHEGEPIEQDNPHYYREHYERHFPHPLYGVISSAIF